MDDNARQFADERESVEETVLRDMAEKNGYITLSHVFQRRIGFLLLLYSLKKNRA
jgi:hypothetical protein